MKTGEKIRRKLAQQKRRKREFREQRDVLMKAIIGRKPPRFPRTKTIIVIPKELGKR